MKVGLAASSFAPALIAGPVKRRRLDGRAVRRRETPRPLVQQLRKNGSSASPPHDLLARRS